MGKEVKKAEELFRYNKSEISKGKLIRLPEENYYGWLINDKQEDLQRILDSVVDVNQAQ